MVFAFGRAANGAKLTLAGLWLNASKPESVLGSDDTLTFRSICGSYTQEAYPRRRNHDTATVSTDDDSGIRVSLSHDNDEKSERINHLQTTCSERGIVSCRVAIVAAIG